VPEDLLPAFVGVYRVPLEPIEVFARFAGKEFEAFAIFAEMIAVADSS